MLPVCPPRTNLPDTITVTMPSWPMPTRRAAVAGAPSERRAADLQNVAPAMQPGECCCILGEHGLRFLTEQQFIDDFASDGHTSPHPFRGQRIDLDQFAGATAVIREPSCAGRVHTLARRAASA